MISSAEKTMTVLGISFRLLNSEIGNDQKSMEMIKKAFRGFRLLNSEIGNDLAILSDCRVIDFSFRLLNSEIGNDLKGVIKIENLTRVFVSLTRR